VTKEFLCCAILCCGVALPARSVYGCRYNVHEVGFIDVGVEPYGLFAYVPDDISDQAVARLQDGVDVMLAETNIRFEVVSAGEDANHPALEYRTQHGITGANAAVLVSPDGQSRVVLDAGPPGSFEERLVSALQPILNSPVRDTVLQKCAESYGVVLFMEGPDAQANATAREAIATATGRIEEQLEFLPKPMAHGPALVVLERESLTGEEVLLWSLGLEPQDVNEPCAAVLYGRGRWIGPLFKGELIHEDHLTELLFIIGADCECGLDHRWLQGTMLPGRWDEGLQAKVAQNLGFDPESPMIKMEMVSIIRRGMGGFAYPGVPFGYREVEVGGQTPDPCLPQAAEVKIEEPPVTAPVVQAAREPVVQAAREPVVAEEAGSEFTVLAASVGGMIVLVALASCVIVLRARKA